MAAPRSAAWAAVAAHAARLEGTHLRELFAADPTRTARFGFERHGLFVDFSKQRIDGPALDALVTLAREAGVEKWRDAMFAGEAINDTERRAVLHVALRHRGEHHPDASHDVMPEVRTELARMAHIAETLRAGRWLGHTGQPIRHVVSIGIGGSDLGPRMAARALQSIAHPTLGVSFVSNLDGAALAPLLAALDPRTTLFIVASKTFTTQETLTNARTARDWLHSHVVAAAGADASPAQIESHKADATSRHFVAVSSAPRLAVDFGVSPDHVLRMWDWVGGRFSLWSAVGLPLMIAIGPRAFDELLAGAAAMDGEFATRPPEDNLPVLMALVGLWNASFLGAETLAVLPYNDSLDHLPAYLQQLEMESNGKSVGRDGLPIAAPACPIVWGEVGINGQHAFFQLLHQGGRRVPCDFIAAARADYPLPGHQDALLANCFAQSAALAFGRTGAEAQADMEKRGTAPDDLARLLPHKAFAGNQPSTTILLSRISPRTLGALIALYEHKVFVQGVLWGINSFDQWGVELGKEVARLIEPALRGDPPAGGLDDSTRRLVEFARAQR